MQAGSAVVSSITGAVTTLATQIQTGPMYNWDSGVANWLQELGKKTATTKLYAEGQQNVAMQLYMQDKAAQAAIDTLEPAAFDETITSALMLADQDTTVRKAVARYGQNHASSLLAGPYESSLRGVNERHARWCSQAEVDQGGCKEAAAPGMEYADVNASTVLYPAAGMTYTDEGRQAAMDYVSNVVGAKSLRVPSSPDSPQAAMVEGMTVADQAALSAAAFSLNSHMAERTRRLETEGP
ncbi:hypothetical protein CSC66_09450 [Pseudoxanthomonas kaohsiungensis]|nr:hypothetical protein CSC66_09450 [Pseudoxanthomonas kaohsiungensis]